MHLFCLNTKQNSKDELKQIQIHSDFFPGWASDDIHRAVSEFLLMKLGFLLHTIDSNPNTVIEASFDCVFSYVSQMSKNVD